MSFVILVMPGNSSRPAASTSASVAQLSSHFPRDAVWLDVAGMLRAPAFRRGYAEVEGTFTAGPGGHFGAGTIAQIQRLEAIK